jgi:hypothetical protein
MLPDNKFLLLENGTNVNNKIKFTFAGINQLFKNRFLMMSLYKNIFGLFFALALFLPISSKAQMVEDGIRFGLKIPYTYDIGYYKRFSSRIGIYADAQFITIPFSNVPLSYMEMWGGDPKLTAILDMPFSIGFGFDVGGHYYFGSDNRRYYVGLSVQWMTLLKRDIEDEVINEAFDVDLSGPMFPEGPITKDDSTKPLTLNSNYFQLGFLIGKKWQLRDPRLEVRVEAAISMNVWSNHFLQSDYRYITPVAEETNTALKDLMRKYAWFPTINMFMIYKLDY